MAAAAIFDIVIPIFNRILLVANHAWNIPSKFDVDGIIGLEVIAI